MRKKTFSIFITFLLIFMLIKFPNLMFDASKKGLLLWFNVVIPSLFPFIVGVSILNYLNFSENFGKVFKKVMNVTFNVSERGAYPFLMGILAGYPMGSKIISNLYETDKISLDESQKLMCFCNNPGILFIIGTVATGMLGDYKVGYIIAISTILSSMTMGILFRFHKKIHFIETENKSKYKKMDFKIGDMLSVSINKSIETILEIGGYIIIFSIIIEALHITNFANYLYEILNLDVNENIFKSLFYGIFEMTNGANIVSSLDVHLKYKAIIITFLINFGGFSIIFQCLSCFKNCKINVSLFILSKLLSAFISSFYCNLIFIPYIFG